MSELRQDRTSGSWVIIAPRRGHRPQARETGPSRARSRFDPECPFCPGHESELPGIIAEAAAPGAPGWRVRVVPNKFPALQAQPDTPHHAEHMARPAYGFHEVIIESPRHGAELETLTVDERHVVVATYRDRARAVMAQPRIETVVPFRNQGRKAGASLLHPHAQIIALDWVPPRLAALSAWGERYHREHGACATCAELQIETRRRARVVEETEQFIALVPFAAEHPFETWIVPLDHQASFADLGEDALSEFGELLARSLRRVKNALNDPPYNFAVDCAPKAELASASFHWRLRIVPDVATWGGFELGSGLPINPSSPEEDAAVLRDTRIAT